MKIRLLVDCRGPNPDFKPPKPIPGDAESMNAWMTYKYRVPPEITVPKGTEIEDPWAWVHCIPNAAGIIRAEPIDDDAKLMVEGTYQTLGPMDRKRIDNLRLQLDIERRNAPQSDEPKIVVQETEETEGTDG